MVGEKIQDPPLHFCQECDHPILVFGRMIPCKHVFCYECASKWDRKCMRCSDPVSRIERCELSQIFVCTHGGPRYGSKGCRRTYLSQRDLDAHVGHRHEPSVRQSQRAPPPHQQAPPSRGNLITIQIQPKQ